MWKWIGLKLLYLSIWMIDKIVLSTTNKIDDAVWEIIKNRNIGDVEIIDDGVVSGDELFQYRIKNMQGNVILLTGHQSQMIDFTVASIRNRILHQEIRPNRVQIARMAREELNKKYGVIDIGLLVTILLPLIVKLIELWLDKEIN